MPLQGYPTTCSSVGLHLQSCIEGRELACAGLLQSQRKKIEESRIMGPKGYG
jgi:hypothetical protein